MINRKRILNILYNKNENSMTWAPRLKLWYETHKKQCTLPNRFNGLDLKSVEKKLGCAAGSTARLAFSSRKGSAHGHIIKPAFKTVNVENRIDKDSRSVIYNTPLGKVVERYSVDYEAVKKGSPMQEYLIEHMIKDEKDYEIVEYIFRDIVYQSNYENYKIFENELGNHGIPIVLLYLDPMYLIMQELIGFNRFFYEFYDNKKRVEKLYMVLFNKFNDIQELAVNSPAKLFIAAGHYDFNMISPAFYDEYMKPYLKTFSEKLRNRNKILGIHADADTKGLLFNLLDTGIQFMDCFVTAPMVTVTLREALNVLKDEVIIYGGIPSNILEPHTYTYNDFERYLIDLFETIKDTKCRIILGVADNVMPSADIDRIEQISKMVKEFKKPL